VVRARVRVRAWVRVRVRVRVTGPKIATSVATVAPIVAGPG